MIIFRSLRENKDVKLTESLSFAASSSSPDFVFLKQLEHPQTQPHAAIAAPSFET